MSNSADPIDGSPQGSPIPGILQARTLEWVAISFSNAGKWKVKVKSLSHVRLLATPWTAAYQAPPSMGFSRQEYWSGVPLPRYPINAISYIVLHCNRFLILFTLIIHRKHVFSSFHSFHYFHFCFHCYHLALLSSASYITADFVLASGHPGLEIKTP